MIRVPPFVAPLDGQLRGEFLARLSRARELGRALARVWRIPCAEGFRDPASSGRPGAGDPRGLPIFPGAPGEV